MYFIPSFLQLSLCPTSFTLILIPYFPTKSTKISNKSPAQRNTTTNNGYLVLASYIPHSKTDVLVLHSLHIETYQIVAISKKTQIASPTTISSQ